MWLMTNFGFFSIVQKKGDDVLTVIARVRSNLEAMNMELLFSFWLLLRRGLGKRRKTSLTNPKTKGFCQTPLRRSNLQPNP